MAEKGEIDRGLPEYEIAGPFKGDKAKVKALNRWAIYDGNNWVVGKGAKSLVLPHGVDPEGVTKQFLDNIVKGGPDPHEFVEAEEVPAEMEEVVDEYDESAIPEPAEAVEPLQPVDLPVSRQIGAAVSEEIIDDLTAQIFAPNPTARMEYGAAIKPRPPVKPAVLESSDLEFSLWLRSASDTELAQGFQVLNNAIAITANQSQAR